MEKLIMWLKLYNIKRLRLATEMSISVTSVHPSVDEMSGTLRAQLLLQFYSDLVFNFVLFMV